MVNVKLIHFDFIRVRNRNAFNENVKFPQTKFVFLENHKEIF